MGKLAEVEHPVACPPQWLPVLLAVNTPMPPTNGRRLQTNGFTNKGDLRTAAQEYDANVTSANVTYGPIADWDVSGITDMSELFKDLGGFNENISSWNTSGVTNMWRMFEVRSSRERLRSQFLVGPSSLHAACAATAPLPPVCRPASRPASYMPLATRHTAGGEFIQPAAESRHVQSH